MLSLETEFLISKLFQQIAESQLSIDASKYNLTESNEFDPYKIFKRLDISSNNYLTAENVIKFMQDNNIYISLKEAKIFICLYDTDNKHNISYFYLIIKYIILFIL